VRKEVVEVGGGLGRVIREIAGPIGIDGQRRLQKKKHV
jgi:hypothetical protein